MTSLLSHLPPVSCPNYLLGRIVHVIKVKQEKRLRSLRIASLSALGGCCMYLGWYWEAFMDRITSSSFLELIRLGFSDPDVTFAHTQEFAWGLIEALPLESLLLGLLIFFFVLGSFAIAQSLRHLHHLSPPQST